LTNDRMLGSVAFYRQFNGKWFVRDDLGDLGHASEHQSKLACRGSAPAPGC
jgi:hypothetical protein